MRAVSDAHNELLGRPGLARPQGALGAWSDLARELVADGAFDEGAILDAEVAVRDASSRNANAIVSSRSGPGYFVKQEAEPGGERETYRRLAEVPALAPFLPAVVLSDASRARLILAVESGAEDLWVHHTALGDFPADLGRNVGRALGVLHRGTRLESPRSAPERAPFVLELHRPRVNSLRELTAAGLDLVTTLQAHPSIGRRLDELRAGWREEAFIHSDVKWPNVLNVPTGDGGAPSIRLVDWEHARDGDPAWDVGSALAAYVSFWLYSIRGSAGTIGADDLSTAARFPLSIMRPAIRACWEEYLDAAEVPSTEIATLQSRAVEFGAARLIRTAFEECAACETMRGSAALHVQVAANMLEDPQRAALALLGLSRRLDLADG